MGSTPTYALPYPETGDPADVSLDMRELAERIEAVLTAGRFAVPAVRITFEASAVGVTGEFTGQAAEVLDSGGIGAVSGTDYQIALAGTYVIVPSVYTINANVGSTAQGRVMLNPAGANVEIANAMPSAGLSTAGSNRYIGGIPTMRALLANDILRARLFHSESGIVRLVGMGVVLVKVA